MYELSITQKNIYWSDCSSVGFSVNTLHIALHFLEKIDIAILKKAVDFVITNNDVFKLRLLYQNGEIFQDFSGKINECNIDSTLYSEEELSAVFMQKKAEAFDKDKALYSFTIFKKTDGLCALSVATHHIIIDGYGMGILCDEVMRAYILLLDGKSPLAGTLPFADSLHTLGFIEEDKAFWSRYFEGYELGGKPFVTKTGFTIASVFRGKIKNTSILDFCAKYSLTPYTVFLAALGIYLMNIYGTDEAIVIIPRMNREMHERKIIGCFTLPVPIRIKKTEDFVDLCEQIRREGRVTSAHKKYNFSQIIGDFKKKFNNMRPISDFTLNFQLKNVKSKIRTKTNFSACGAMYNILTLNISNYEDDDFYEITYDYRGDVLNEKYMSFFHNALDGIIKQGLDRVPVSNIKIVPEAELKYLKTEFTGETILYDCNETIISLFKKIVLSNPNDPAVFTRDKEIPMTFSELDNISNRLAVALTNNGAVKGSLIGFLLERNSTLLPVILGILKAGCGFLPLDINYPKGRIDYIIRDSKAKIIISTPEAAGILGLDYVDVNQLLLDETDAPLNVLIDQNDLAYCIYTSGTTGQPKGVLLAHKGIVNITSPLNNPFNKAVCEIGTGIVAIGSICFDISLFEIFVFLLNGKFVAIAADDELANGEAIAELIQETGANALHCTPSRLHSYISGNLFAYILKTQIKVILSAGELLPSRLVAMITEYNVKIYNGYGPTETTIGATITEAGDYETIGKPIANTTVYIVNKKKMLLPFGVIGEIVVAGDGVGIGYLGKDKLTVEKFTLINNERAYLTGDFGYFTTDGRLKYVARSDSQVKLHGYRIELSEIEQCAQTYDGIDNCAVIVKEIGDENYLIFYYSGKESDSQNIKEYFSKFLPRYMVPQMAVQFPSLPTNKNGKIDRLALTKLSLSMKKEYVPPSSREEEILCEAFREVLSLQRIGIDDNFFEIGGTSLSAIKMMMYANKHELNVEYPAIFEYATPRLLARNIGIRKIKNYLLPFVHDNEKEFEKIDQLLQQNSNSTYTNIPLGNVLVTGATGFLGSHIVSYLLKDSTVGNISCIVRAKGKLAPMKRLKTTLFYYFNDVSEEQFAKKINIIDGDMTDKRLFDSIAGEITTVINCAANVAHFTYGNALKSVNIDAMENLIDFCKTKDATLIHISTISVAGHNLDENVKDIWYMESDLYKGQIISNKYIYSKFAAEYLVLKAKVNGLKAKIMRLGNLQGRMDDGEFQMNLQENAFARSIKSYAAIGMAPASLRRTSVNITPIDETAEAVLLLAGLPDSFTVFHVINIHPTSYEKIFSGLLTIGKEVQYMENKAFETLIDKFSKDDSESLNVEGLLFEKSDIRLRAIPVDGDFTVITLKKLGFEFKAIEEEYIVKYLYLLNGLGFFD